MASSNATEQFAVIHRTFNKTIEEILAAQIDMETSFTCDAKEQHRKIERMIVGYEQAIDGYVTDMENHLVNLKTRLNSFVRINKLPVELLPRIVLFTTPWHGEEWRHYLSYTWVCHHWRSVLIQAADLWTKIYLNEFRKKPINRFIFRELLRRSKSAKLDVTISISSSQFKLILKDLAEESHRIYTLKVDSQRVDEIALACKGRRFPSLRRIVYYDWTRASGLGLIPVIVAADHLETLEISFWHNITSDAINQLATVFTRTTRNLCFYFNNLGSLQLVLKLLHNNIKLQTLRIRMSSPLDISGQTLLPELQFLSGSASTISLFKVVRAPKLSSLDFLCYFPITMSSLDYPIFENFYFVLTKYLYVMDPPSRLVPHDLFSIMGFKELIHPKLVFSVESGAKETRFIEEAQEIVNESTLSDDWPRGIFRFRFYHEDAFFQTVKGALFSLLPRFTGLLEICLASHTVLRNKEFHLDEFLAQASSLQKLTVLYGDGLINFIHLLTANTSLCTRLEHLSYTTSHPDPEEAGPRPKCLDVDKVGELLTNCVRTRREIYDGGLRHIALGKCPPLPGTWLRKLQKLGTTVVTHNNKKDVENKFCPAR